MDHGEVDVAAVAHEVFVEHPRGFEHHRQQQAIGDRAVGRLAGGQRVGGDERRDAVVGVAGLCLLAGLQIIEIEPRPRLAAEAARLYERRDHGRGLDAVAVRVVQHEPGVEGRVEADHVVQLERTHRHAECAGHAVDPPWINPFP